MSTDPLKAALCRYWAVDLNLYGIPSIKALASGESGELIRLDDIVMNDDEDRDIEGT